MACSGLEHAKRGFESFARECFEALRDEPSLQLHLVKGSGNSGDRESLAWTLRRDLPAVKGLAGLCKLPPFRLEGALFGLGLQSMIARTHPDLIYLSEWDTARVLSRLRKVTRQRFRILYCNGSFASGGFDHLDHVQQLTPAARDYVVERGADPRHHTVLPLGFEIPPRLESLGSEKRLSLRRQLRLPENIPIVLSVAALNRQHKRLDYLIDEVAALPHIRPFLLMAGEPDAETPDLRRQAQERLGPEGFDMRTVPASVVPDLCRASDVFVLASLEEMQGRSLIEAASHGMPCIAHDSPITRYALGDRGSFGDLRCPGVLATLLADRLGAMRDGEIADGQQLHRHVYERFSWERLTPVYVDLLTTVADRTETAQPARVTSAQSEPITRAP